MNKSKLALTAGTVAAIAVVGPASSSADAVSSAARPSVQDAIQLAQARMEQPMHVQETRARPHVTTLRTLRLPPNVHLRGNLNRPVSPAARRFIKELADSVARAPTNLGQAASFGEIGYKYAITGGKPMQEITVR